MEKVCIYLRQSTKDKQKYSLESQETSIREWCKNEHMEIVQTFTDMESGTKKDRKGLKKAIEYCEQNNTPIVVLRVDRLSRSPSQMFGLLESPKLKIYITELGLQADPMLVSLLVLHSKMEIDLLSRRTKEGMKTALAKRRALNPDYKFGNPVWEKSLPKARIKRQVIANQKATEYSSLLRSLYNECRSYNKVANQLNLLEIKTPRGNKWSRATVRRMLLRIEKLDK